VAEREHKSKASSRATEDTVEVEPAEAMDTSAVDDLLDEIDDVLESNAEQFVRQYIQKGGE
jgi:ubiquitin-like protein Pup